MKKNTLGIFSLMAINIIAVDNLRSLPFSAEYGFSLIFYYLLAAVCFFLPVGFVAAELASGWPRRGGIYVWVREAFGKRMGFFLIYLQWIYNVVWYPTILSFVAATLSFFFNPELATNRWYLFSTILILYWGMTLINWFGMKLSSYVSHIGAIIGTVLPMIFIALLGLVWWLQGNPIEIAPKFLPDLSSVKHLTFLLAILFGLIGLEMSASHADEVKDPHSAFPKAIFYSAIIILISLIGASLAIAISVPTKELNIITGLVQAYRLFLAKFGLGFLAPVIEGLIVLGGLSSVAAWIIGPSKGLYVSSVDGIAPKFFSKHNKHNVPTGILLLQGIIFTLLSSLFIFLPSVSTSYWALSAITAQLALIVYLGLFAAGIYLRYKEPDMPRAYKIPFGNLGMWVVGGLGFLSCLFGIALGFIPPSQIDVGSILTYEAIIIGGMLIFCIPPFFLYRSSSCRK
ncbi:MAG: Glutamate/gamma-aminobutyrate antiporter [Chlamydiia bacterium]|nr:Glutamate/gamma-aminobutyrate antiporter [Chlamydiia bacterium]MCH9615582.1 Glutamate/gamma-aminobutyrate antiporter [Chlamydiia bacterium]MCH9629237.1 Glutamate/gamma-aminobutyrate antiporter [Chlamydiia bacterium]